MAKQSYKTDIALMSVTSTEFSAVNRLHDWRPVTLVGDRQIYDVAEFERDGRVCSLVHVKQGEVGMTSAAATAMKLIYEYRPRYLIMVGIAAGVALESVADQIYGDVVVPDIVWNYSAGKFVTPEKAEIRYGDVGFQPRATVAVIPEGVLPYVRQAMESPENQCHVHIGPMACGSTVVSNRKILDNQIYTQLRNTIGLDMESYAVVYAALHATDPRPVPLVIKSVCDYADSQKSDDYQRFAAFTSCEFAKLLYEKYLPLDVLPL